MIDALAAVCNYLLSHSDVTDQVDQRVFGGELPEREIEHMPQKAVVVQYDGGLVVASCLPLSSPRFNIFSYGRSYYEAGEVDRAVYSVLKNLTRTRVGEALLYSVTINSGPFMARDDKTDWHFQWRNATIKAADTEIIGG
jgi:hypothetical protein